MRNLNEVLLETVHRTEDNYIFVEPVCTFFGISYINQKRKIADDPICQSGSTKKYCQSLFGDKRLRLCVDKRAFIRWIQIINGSIVHSNLRKLFQQYQVAVFDYLYLGTEAKNIQLEDIRTYALSINNAIHIKNHVMEYVGEQKRHRDLCLSSTPTDWVKIRASLLQAKAIPAGTDKLIAIDTLPNNIDELKQLKKNLQTNVSKNNNVLLYQQKTKATTENPLPDGYRREHLKNKIRQQQARVDAINEKLLTFEIQEG